MRHLYPLLVISLLLALAVSCKEAGGQVVLMNTNNELPYNFNQADARFGLHASLSEISGLAFDRESATLLAINDEKGKVYRINPVNGQSRTAFDFGQAGDYEGIAIRGTKVYILKSNGHLYRYHTQKERTKEKRNILTPKNDCEGLAYLAGAHQLLIACKGQNLAGQTKPKVICAYNLETDQLLIDPVLSIDPVQLADQLEQKGVAADLRYRLRRFSPSGIAIGPDGSWYILSARGSSMLVYSQQILQQLVFFNISELPQPEGICFDEQMNLYIASEGKNGNGRLVKFNYQE